MNNWIQAEESYVVGGRIEDVYAVVADYEIGHQAIVPREYFTSLVVEQGGRGAGTVLRGSLKVFGREYSFHQLVTEPEPGRAMLETDIDTGQLTGWRFEPLGDGAHTRVTIHSDFPPSPGLLGVLERLTKPAVVRAIYRKELRNLDEYIRARFAVPAQAEKRLNTWPQ
jgi:hypothetical protein